MDPINYIENGLQIPYRGRGILLECKLNNAQKCGIKLMEAVLKRNKLFFLNQKRRIGISTLIAAYANFLCNKNKEINVGIIVGRSIDINVFQTSLVQPRTINFSKINRNYMCFENKSTINFYDSHNNAYFRGYGHDYVFIDNNVTLTQDLYYAIMPTLSNPNNLVIFNYIHETYKIPSFLRLNQFSSFIL